jgi:hypothetical protein
MFKKLLILGLYSSLGFTDNIENYMNIATQIPQMQLKADPKAQSWAKSAQNVLLVSSESIAESIRFMNQKASDKGIPFFCSPPGEDISPALVDAVIQQTYKELSSQSSQVLNMTVSEVALIGLQKKYPCKQAPAAPSQFSFGQAQPMQAHVSAEG